MILLMLIIGILYLQKQQACVIPEILQGLSGMIATEGGNAVELSGTILAQLNQFLTGYRITATRFPV